jgi:hypothetical protein
MIFYLPVVLMILGTTTYHVAQKSVPVPVNPLFSLVINYLTALAGTLVLIPLYLPRTAGPWSLKTINWASAAVGVSIVGVELAVLLIARDDASACFRSSATPPVALLLVGVGLVFLSTRNLAGIVLCLVGLALVTQH